MQTVLQLQSCRVDLDRRLVERADEREHLTDQEASVLAYLAARPEQTVERTELLVDVLGYSPRSVSRAIDVCVRRLRMKIERDPSAPTHLVSVRGVGYRFEPTADRPVPSVPAEPPIAVPPDDLIGRDADLASLRSRWDSGVRLLTLHGPPGVGKTRLALHLAAGLQADGGCALWVDLSSATSEGDVLRSLAAALRVPPTDDRAGLSTRVQASLRARGPCTVALDTLEHVVEPAASVVAQLLRACPQANVIATTREPLRVDGEVRFTVEPLSVEDATELLWHRAAAAGVSWSAEDREVTAGIAAQLDCNPLALELAAARAPILSPSMLARALEQRFQLLTRGRRGSTERQSTLWGCVSWSWSLLSAAEQDALAQCSVFRGGFDLEAAEAVVDLSAHPDAPLALDWVQALVDRSLLRVEPGTRRLGMSETMRAFAAAQLGGELGEDPGAAGRHLAWADALGTAQAEAVRCDPGSPLEVLARESENLFAAVRHGAHGEAAARVALALDLLLRLRGPSAPRMDLLAVALDHQVSAETQVRGLIARAGLRARRGDLDGAHADLDRAEGLGTALDAEIALRRTWIEDERADWETCRRHAREALRRAGARGDEQTAAAARVALGHTLVTQGRPEEATPHLAEALNWSVEAGDWQIEFGARNNLGRVARQRGELDRARRLYRQALALADEAGDVWRASTLLGNLGMLAAVEGSWDESVACQEQRVERLRRLGLEPEANRASAQLGEALLAAGHMARARDVLAGVVLDPASLDDELRTLMGVSLGVATWAAGSVEEAHAVLARTAAEAQAETEAGQWAELHLGAARVVLGRDDGGRVAAGVAWLRASEAPLAVALAEVFEAFGSGSAEAAAERAEALAGEVGPAALSSGFYLVPTELRSVAALLRATR